MSVGNYTHPHREPTVLTLKAGLAWDQIPFRAYSCSYQSVLLDQIPFRVYSRSYQSVISAPHRGARHRALLKGTDPLQASGASCTSQACLVLLGDQWYPTLRHYACDTHLA